MNKTDQFHATWLTLKSEDAINKMIVECDCKSDELHAALIRFGRVTEKREKDEKVNNLASQLKFAGITADVLKDYLNKKTKNKK